MEQILIADSAELLQYSGYLCAQGEQYRVAFRLKDAASRKIDPASFACEPRLRQLLHDAGILPVLVARLAQAPDVDSAVSELNDVIQRIFRAAADNKTAPAEYYSRFVAEIDKVGWEHLVSLDLQRGHLQLAVTDATSRQHVFNVALPPDYPRYATCRLCVQARGADIMSHASSSSTSTDALLL